MSEKLCPYCGSVLEVYDAEYDTHYRCFNNDCVFAANSDSEYELLCDAKQTNNLVKQLQSTISTQSETIKRYQGLMEHHIVGKCSNCNYMASWPVCTKCGTSYPAQELEVKE